MDLCNKRLSLINVYGPSDRDDILFFEQFFDTVSNVGNDNMILGGDWNVPLDLNLDTRNYRGTGSRTRSREKIINSSVELELVDIFRLVHPDKQRFTWRRFNSNVQSRLDYFLVSESLLQDLNSADIVPGYRSDHSIVILGLRKDEEPKKRQYWKFNNSLLYDKNYVNIVKETISNVKKQYMLPVYNTDNLDQISDEDIVFIINDQLFFETLLMELRGKSISYASHKKKMENNLEIKLTQEISNLESKEVLDDGDINLLGRKKTELEAIRNKKIQGMIIRSRHQWIHKGEQPTNYFCKLENRNFNAKHMNFLEKSDNTLIFENEEIVEETKNYYKELYSKKNVTNVNLDNLLTNHIKLNDLESERLEGKLTYKEAQEALKDMKNNKSPGSDGFTSEFFKFFFLNIGHFLVRSLNYGFDQGELSVTQKQGIITCIPKEGKDKRYLKNWRPISLLNISYKIASSCIANRMKCILSKLVHNYQKGFMAGKYLGENIRMIYDIINYAEKENKPGLLLLVDFEKAFDSISWAFISNVLSYFNFGPMFMKWVDVFYHNICSCISVNGTYSSWFAIQRGVRQGDPLSPYLYLICAEVLSIMLRESNQVKGITVNNQDFLLSQFADDTAICLDGTEDSFNETIRLLSNFADFSGLKINFDKTIVTWIGSMKNSNIRFLRDKNFCWDPGIFTYLGIKFSLNINSMPDINYSDKLKEIKNLLLVWKKRQLTPFGKITVLKTLAISKITHLFLTLPDPSDKFMNQLDRLFFQFLWDEKPSKIHRKIVGKSYENGGLNMIDVYAFLTKMKLSWIKRLFISNTPFHDSTLALFPCLKNLNKMGSNRHLFLQSRINNAFWSDVLKHFLIFNKRVIPTNLNEFNAEFIFQNENILVGNASILYNDWIENNVYQISNLLDGEGKLLTFVDFCNKFPFLNCNFLQYQGVIRAIQNYKNRLNIHQNENYKEQNPIALQHIFEGKRKINSVFEDHNFLAKNLVKWNLIFNNIQWKNVFEKCQKTTIDCKLRWLQYRIIYRVVPTNRYLFIRKIKDESICEMCRKDEEDLKHMFYSCEFVSKFWDDLRKLLVDNCNHIVNLTLSEELVFFGTKENMYTDSVFDLILLLAKYYIYSLKLTVNLVSKCFTPKLKIDMLLRNIQQLSRIK